MTRKNLYLFKELFLRAGAHYFRTQPHLACIFTWIRTPGAFSRRPSLGTPSHSYSHLTPPSALWPLPPSPSSAAGWVRKIQCGFSIRYALPTTLPQLQIVRKAVPVWGFIIGGGGKHFWPQTGRPERLVPISSYYTFRGTPTPKLFLATKADKVDFSFEFSLASSSLITLKSILESNCLRSVPMKIRSPESLHIKNCFISSLQGQCVSEVADTYILCWIEYDEHF